MKNVHGSITVSANAAGYARIFMSMHGGNVAVYNDATHTETVLGPVTVLLGNDADYLNANYVRICAAGVRLRSLASNLNDAGTM